jgi:hypothetical protein
MPLTWDITQCADLDKIKSDAEWGITNTLILMTMNIGIGRITEKNAAEVYARLMFLDRIYGPAMYGTDEDGKTKDVSFTPQMVRDRIGLRCNVPDETWASFQRRHLKWFRPDREREYNDAFKEQAGVTG